MTLLRITAAAATISLTGCATTSNVNEVRVELNRLSAASAYAAQKADGLAAALNALRQRQVDLDANVSALLHSVEELRRTGATDARARYATVQLESYIRAIEQEHRTVRTKVDRLEFVQIPGTNSWAVRVLPTPASAATPAVRAN